MTNAEKYLKDGVDLEEFSKSIMTWYFGNYAKANDFARIKNWSEHKIETLTEDERVILRNIHTDKWEIIGKSKFNELYLKNYADTDEIFIKEIFEKSSFPSIKNGEEYSIKELLGDEK